ncbi:MAG: type II secretion system F family protein [Candidatus Omnitrophica bacterium]|nr:type II secretion system F family protein [Candidatus Omnitrophota bacterium]
MLLPLACIFFAVFALILGFSPVMDNRPKLKLNVGNQLKDLMPKAVVEDKKNIPANVFFFILSKFALFNRPLSLSSIGQRIYRDLNMARSRLNVDEFFLIKELLIFFFIFLVLKFNTSSDLTLCFILGSFAFGYMIPELWLKARIRKVKDEILRTLPDIVDLLGLCVNAGLDFMMALKYVVEKSAPTVVIDELRNMMQEINVGKPRRDALRDMARKYELPDLSTFSRTLIQADRMGTSVSEALNMLTEDMRDARFRRGEAMALKAPLKMLVPLLFFIFPVVALLVAGPVFLDFMQNNPIKNLSH